MNRMSLFFGVPELRSLPGHFRLETVATTTEWRLIEIQFSPLRARRALERVPGSVGLSSAEAYISLLETSDTTLATGEDTAKDTGPSPSRHTVQSKDQHKGNSVRARGAETINDLFYRNTSGGANEERHFDADLSVQRALIYSSRNAAET